MLRALGDYLVLSWRFRRWSSKRIAKHQLRALRRLLSYARAHSPFYQARFEGITFDTIDAVRRLPTLDKATMMTHFDDLNTCGLKRASVEAFALNAERTQDYLGYYEGDYVIGLSSGTSGHRGLYITPKALTKRLPGVFLARGGLSLRDLPLRIVFLLRVYSQGFDDINAPLIQLKYMPTTAKPEAVIERIRAMRANVLMAPPSYLRFLLPHAADLAGRFKRIITYAEVLTAEDKARYAQAFNTSVVEIYQASEGQMASPCSQGHLHINEDLVHVDLYDVQGQRITEPGVIGHKMVVTNLINTAQPLIRYVMNDMVVLDTPCPCGSNFRRIKQVLGRHDDVFYFPDATGKQQPVFPDLIARWLLVGDANIAEFQAIQKEHGTMHITIDPLKTPFDADALVKQLQGQLRTLGLEGTVTVYTGALTIPKDSHKYKRFIQQDRH
ncbi:MAG: hypothetical protein EA374_01295 [Acholeplasmatales bacterium]|nr:MAG: hypothetical protein EA374_01295 [Acholeplasmatales bacterium]